MGPARSPRLVALACALALAAAGQPAGAADSSGPPWLKLDRVEVADSFLHGHARVRVFVSAITLEGGTIPITGKKEWQLQLGSSKKRIPYLAGQWKEVDEDLAVMIVVNTGADFARELPKIQEALRQMLQALPKDTQVGVIGYADEIEGDRKVGSRDRAIEKIDELATSPVADQVELVSAVRRAVDALRRVKPSKPGRGLRKLVVVISDGLDVEHDSSRFRGVGKRADDEHVRIHTLAYSVHNHRAPMVGLAELSKRSHGTFRLVYTKDSFAPNLTQLAKEIEQQYVLTFFVPADEVDGKRVRVIAKDITSNDSKAIKVTCGEADKSCAGGQLCAGERCVSWEGGGGRGILGWILLIGGILLGVIVVLGVIGYFMTKRQQTAGPLDPDAIIAAAQAKAMGSKPPKSVPPQAVPQNVQAHAAQVIASATISGPRFYIASGPRQGEQVALKHGFSIGKQQGNDLVIDDGFTSSQHAQIGMDHFGNCRIYDRGSTNGTYVNGQRVTEYALEHGMAIRIGSTELRFLAQ